MKQILSRRAALGALACLTAGSAVHAADPWPSKPIKIIVNSGAGALLDANVRLVAQKMSENLGQPIYIENLTGGGGLIGIRQVKAAAPDGYTLIASANTLALALALRKEPGYELKDFAPVAMVSQTPYMMIGATSLPDKTLAEFVNHVKAQPGKLDYASGGMGTSTHMSAAMFLSQAGLSMQHIPYRGNAGAMPDVLSGRVTMIFDGPNTAWANAKDGKVRIYGITSPKRSPSFPDVPTIAEQGYPNFSFFGYAALAAPAGTPREVVQRLAQAARFAHGTPEVRNRFRSDGSDVPNMSPEELTQFLRNDAEQAIKLAAEFKIPKE